MSQVIRGIQVDPYGSVLDDWIWNVDGRKWRLVTADQLLQTYQPTDEPYPPDGWVTQWHTIALHEAVGYSLGYARKKYRP